MRDLWKLAHTAFVVLTSSIVAPATLSATEQPAAAEHNPPGDIPDSQVFIRYVSPAGYEVKVPEGWSRKATNDTVSFADKYDIISLTVARSSSAPTLESVRTGDVPTLEKAGRAFSLKDISARKLDGGSAIRLIYQTNSEPNAVTGKQMRLEHERFFFFRDGSTTTLDLAAPVGADNADQWQLISNSFRWR